MERLENKRVNKYLDDIVQEVEAKAPILKRQRDEHERMQKSVASLSAKLEQAVKVGIYVQWNGKFYGSYSKYINFSVEENW